VDFEPTTSLPGDGIEAFPRSNATTAPFPLPIDLYSESELDYRKKKLTGFRPLNILISSSRKSNPS
jgi:hypothetical protein